MGTVEDKVGGSEVRAVRKVLRVAFHPTGAREGSYSFAMSLGLPESRGWYYRDLGTIIDILKYPLYALMLVGASYRLYDALR